MIAFMIGCIVLITLILAMVGASLLDILFVISYPMILLLIYLFIEYKRYRRCIKDGTSRDTEKGLNIDDITARHNASLEILKLTKTNDNSLSKNWFTELERMVAENGEELNIDARGYTQGE